MPRSMLTDEQWSKLKIILQDARIYDKPRLRLTVEGMIFRMRAGARGAMSPKNSGTGTAFLNALTNGLEKAN